MANSKVYFHKKRILKYFSLFFFWLFFLAFITSFSFFLDNSLLLKKKRIFYVPFSGYLKKISGSFRSFFADIFYIRGVLAITDEIENRNLWIDWVQKNFEVAINLDPKLIESYFFAGVVVGRNKQGLKKGIDFLKRGLKLAPGRWEIPYWIGFNYYQLGDYLKAVQYYDQASKLPEAPKFLKSIQPMFYYKAGRPDLGIIYLEGLLNSIKDPSQLKWIEIKLKWLKNIVFLENKVKQFKQIYGRLPKSLEELIKFGLINKIPDDPFGKGYYLDKDSGRIKSRFGASKEETQNKNRCPKCK